MKYVPPKFTKLSDMAAIDVGRLTEDEARHYPGGDPLAEWSGMSPLREQDGYPVQAKSEKVPRRPIPVQQLPGAIHRHPRDGHAGVTHYVTPVGTSLPFYVLAQEGRVRPSASAEPWASHLPVRLGSLPIVSGLP